VRLLKNLNHKNLEKITAFIKKHHLLTLATSKENMPQVANLFFAYDEENIAFIVASDTKTEHIQNVLQNENVATSVALETDEVGKIQGLQCKARMFKASLEDKKLYFKKYPYAIAMNPNIWKIEVDEMKYTDNRLGFGKKLMWKREEQ